MDRRQTWSAAATIGVGLLLIIGALTVTASSNLLSDPPNLGADYIGSQRCINCHNADSAALWDAWNMTLHAQTIRPTGSGVILGDLSDMDALTVTWPDGQVRPITAGDITYVIGGRYTQQYISVREREDGETGYFVLPVVWNIAQTQEQSGLWTLYHPDDWTTPERDWRLTCAGCHTSGLTTEALERDADFALVGDWDTDDVELGIGCESCHGPGGDHNRGENLMPRTPDAQVCGQCHAQGTDPSGDHPFPLDYQPGLALDEMFVFAGADDETVWWSDGHARASASQYNEWLVSSHASALTTLQDSALAGDSCLRCHTTLPDRTDPTPDAVTWTLGDAQYGVTCTTCHNPHPAESQPRALINVAHGPGGGYMTAPQSDTLLRLNPDTSQGQPGQEGGDEETPLPFLLQADTYTLCVNCHNSATPEGEVMWVGETLHHPVQEMFEGTAVLETVEGIPATHFSQVEGPRCVTCHMSRTIQIGEYGRPASHRLTPVLPNQADDGQPDSCSGCHDGLNLADLQYLVDDTQESVRTRLSVAFARLGSVDEPAPDADTRGRYEETITALNFVQNDGSLGVHNYAYTDALLNFAEHALTELAIPGASMQATEAPAPTATPSGPETTESANEVAVSSGVRPVTALLMGVIILILLVSAFLFFRKSGNREANT